MSQRTRKAVVAGVVGAAILVHAFGCVGPLRDVGTEVPPDGSAGFGPFAPAADGAADAAGNTKPEIQMCVATECPYPWATCPLGQNMGYKCAANLLTDSDNCGACRKACPIGFVELFMSSRCVEGTCRRECLLGHGDCNGLVDDGCETNTEEDPDHCGACGNKCPEVTEGVRECVRGQCRGGCPPPTIWCDPICTDITNDNLNCGSCGHECPPLDPDTPPPPPNMVYTCVGGECGKLACLGYWRNCNGDIQHDGCEVDTARDPQHCSKCGGACAPGQFCTVRQDRGREPVCACEPNETLCGEQCVDLLSDVHHCGACGHECLPIAGGSTACRNGFCESECDSEWADCDGDARNECETYLKTNPLHCGACGNQCDMNAGQPCVDGKCLVAPCDAGSGAAK